MAAPNPPAGSPGPERRGGPRGRRRLRLVPLSLALLVLLVLAMLGYYWIVVRPWTAPPDVSERELAALWEAVERNAATPVDVTGSAEDLVGVLRQLEEAPELSAIVEEWREEGRVDPGDRALLEERRRIGAQLIGWYETEGGLGDGGPCQLSEDLPPIDLFRAGLVALAQADVVRSGASREKRLVSILHLARTLRRGGGPLHLAVGVRLAEHVAKAAARMDALEVLRSRPELAPRAEEIWHAVNVEAYCVDELLERQFEAIRRDATHRERADPVEAAIRGALRGSAGAAASGQRPVPGAPRSWIGAGEAFFRRERAMVRSWWGRRIEAATPAALNPPRLAEALRLPEDLDELPKSLVLRIVAADLAPVVIDAGNALRAYRETVGLPME